MKPKTAVELYDSDGEVVYILPGEPITLNEIAPKECMATLTVLLTPALKSELLDYFLKEESKQEKVDDTVLKDFSKESANLRVGERICAIREAHGLTQNELAKAAGLSQATLSNAEAGRRGLSHKALVKLCDTLKLRPIIFLNDDFLEEEIGKKG